MKTKFILSLDCEGKWGIADKLENQHHASLSQERLITAYDQLLQMLSHYQIPATFAFVGLFRHSFSQLKALDWDTLRDLFPYVHNAHADLLNGSEEGWDGDWALKSVRQEITFGIKHEIACHGGTHTPFQAMNEEQARADLALCDELNGQTFIFPRNSITHLDLLKEHGVLGYRTDRPGTPASRILDEVNVFQRGEKATEPANFHRIPAGFFINWKSGFRRHIPVTISDMRYKAMFTSTPSEDHVIHFWSHPENFASAPETFNVLEALLKQVKKSRDQGELEVVTQHAYCMQRRSK